MNGAGVTRSNKFEGMMGLFGFGMLEEFQLMGDYLERYHYEK